MRCFAALELPDEIASDLAQRIAAWRQHAPQARFCIREQLHITLKFLGDVEPGTIEPLGSVLSGATAQIDPFPLALRGLGAFPNERAPRIFWCGVIDDARACERWLTLAQPGLQQLGFAPEDRPFHAHVTLARARDPAGSAALRGILRTPQSLPANDFIARRITLFESNLTQSGALYRPIAHFPLHV